ncbi:unnamed protein product [Rotaria sp. Silwood1]|nr:unnamed protein product [Rotaria sp. Silwood1]CAF3459268.1 unnamed protein product [Rotaria sp. Silwood1]CAF3486561.1 unnamed protein product [Rotaria sp. Silwood1]CAF4740721.1 unnamed protein product [Rotaria sp. Silwood1]CAF4799289.1 unnamed protein product [Rotaria sp. Silwood1]
MTTKGYNHFKRFHASTSSSHTEQKVCFEKETQSIMFENIETPTINPTENNRRRNSRTFIKKLLNTTYNSKLKNGNKRNSNSVDDNMFDENEKITKLVSKTNSIPSIVHQSVLENEVYSKSRSNEEFKPKGILKNSKSNSYADQVNEICNSHNRFQSRQTYSETCHTTNSKENSNDFVPVINENDSSSSTSKSSLPPVKCVKFSDMICETISKPNKSMPITIKYSCDQKRNSQDSNLMNITEVNSYDENSIDKVQFYTVDSLPFEELNVHEPSDNKPTHDGLVMF